MKKHLTATLALLSIGALSSANAQGFGSITIGPSGITITPANPAPSALSVDVNLDRDRTGNQTPVYYIGEKAKVTVKTNRDAYVYLFNVDSQGRISQLPTARNNAAAFLRGGSAATFPAANAGYDYTVSGPAGIDRLYAIAAPKQLSSTEIRRLQQQVVRNNDWAGALQAAFAPTSVAGAALDVANWEVRQQIRQQNGGSLLVTSNVPGARVMLGNRDLGGVGSAISGLRAGSYAITVTAPGYASVNATVAVSNGRTTNFNANLTRARMQNNATLLIESNVAGARVIVDGRDVGTVGRAITGLRAGNSTVRVEAPGYNPMQIDMQILANQTNATRVELSRQQAAQSEGSLRVNTNVAGARVFLNGREVGGVNSNLRGIAPGIYNIRVEARGYNSAELRMEILPSQLNTVHLDLTPERAASRLLTLTLHGAIDGSEVRIDGRHVGYIRNGQLTVEVERGTRNVTLISPRGVRDDFSVEMSSSRNVEVSQMSSEFIYDLLR